MHPAIWSNRHAAALILIIAVLLALPVAVGTLWPLPRETVLTGIRIEAGPVPYDVQQIFDEKTPIDIVFVGSSLLVRGVDTDYVQAQLSKLLQRPATVRYVALKWQGLDMQYMLMRDLLERRKVRMVVMAMPNRTLGGDSPHIQAYRWMRWGDFPESLGDLPFRSRPSVYAMEVLGAPRQLLNHLRSNGRIHDPQLIATLGTQHEAAFGGYYGNPFVQERKPAPVVPAQHMIAIGADDPRFDFNGRPLGPYHRYWGQQIGKLARERGAALAMLHIPEDSERGSNVVPERMYWPDVVGMPAPIIGLPSAELFADMPAATFYHYYFDQHLNMNGKEFFTRAITPAILDVYEKSAH
jgi:hypothetical protein